MVVTSKLTIFGIIAMVAVLLTPLANDYSVNAAPQITITVNALDLSGGIHHMYTTLQNPSGTVIATGFTPVSFSATSGQQYIVHVSNYQTTVFNHWDDSTTNQSRSITPTQSVTLTAYFSTGSINTVPGAPTGLVATAVSSSQINLAWTAPSNNGGSAITGYKIERSTDGGTTWSTIVTNTNSPATSYSDSSLVTNTTYTYRTSAINSIGTGSPSNTASATTTTSTQITITVNALDLSGGVHHMSTELENPSGTVIATGFTPVSFSATSGQQYIVFVNNYQTTVFNHWDDGTTNPSRSITPTQNVVLTAYYSVTTVPGAPTGLGATAGNAQVLLSWTAPSNNGGSAITGYNVYRGPASGGEGSTPIATGITGTTYTDTGLVNSQTYYYTVAAVNSVGTGSSSNEASATSMGEPTVPGTPTNLAATAVSPSQINLSWISPTNIGGSAITGYKIERSADGGTTWSTIVSNTGTTSTTYSNTGLTASTTYTYRVFAINSVGTSSPSNTASDTTPSPTQSINKVQSGLVTFDPLNNQTQTQQQLQANQQYWKYFGDAPARNAPYDFFKDNQGLHVGVEAPSNGTWAGFYAESPDTNALLFHGIITTPVSTLPSQHNWFENGMYIQTNNGSINYVSCFSITSILGTQWTLGSATGSTHKGTSFQTFWTDTSPNQPLTRDCTIITNGNNYLKAYIDGVLVYSNSTLNLQMPPPFNVYLEPQSSYAGQLLNGSYNDYYATADENIKVINLPSNASTVSVTDSFGTMLASGSVSNGNATIDVGQYHFPLAGIIKAYDSKNKLVDSTSGVQNIYGGDVYSNQ